VIFPQFSVRSGPLDAAVEAAGPEDGWPVLLLWREWSPTRPFAEADFERTVLSFDNPDFVDIAVHSCRHRYGLVPGAAEYEDDELQLAGLPPQGHRECAA
jgi:hypothetical protein